MFINVFIMHYRSNYVENEDCEIKGDLRNREFLSIRLFECVSNG